MVGDPRGMGNGTDLLTAKEREVLLLVAQHLTSKEIAPRLGIAPDSVDARAKRAMRKLGFTDRGKAAAFLAAHERIYPRPGYPPPDVAAMAEIARLGAPAKHLIQDVRLPFPVLAPPVVDADAPAPLEEGTRNRFCPWSRIAIIAGIAVGGVVAIGATISALNGLIQLALSRHLF